LVIKSLIMRTQTGDELTQYSVDDEATLANLRGEEADGTPLADDDPPWHPPPALEVGTQPGRLP